MGVTTRKTSMLLAATAAVMSIGFSPYLASASTPPPSVPEQAPQITTTTIPDEPPPGSTASSPTPPSSTPSTAAEQNSTTPAVPSGEKTSPTPVAPGKQLAPAVTAGCQTYPPTTFEVCGRIRDKYNQTGGPAGFLLFPKSNELTNPGNTGKRTEFLGGNIYWSAATDAHPVAHDFLTKWGQYGYEAGFMKYPTTDEILLGDNDGRRQEFQGAYMYYSIPTGTHNVQGAILDRYKAIGAQNSVLGYPTSDELVTPDGKGRYNTFEYGSLYWSASSGAHAVYGDILNKWGAAGYEAGTYGYPTGDRVETANGGVSQAFQRGTITVSAPNLGNPPYRRGVDKEIGPNLDDAQECVQGYDTGKLTFFQATGETLYCKDFRHIYRDHFPQLPGNEINPVNWDDFQTCVAYTLASSERGFSPTKDKAYGRTRYNTHSDTRSFAVVRDIDTTDVYPEDGTKALPLSIVTAYTQTPGGRDWGGCRKDLSS